MAIKEEAELQELRAYFERKMDISQRLLNEVRRSLLSMPPDLVAKIAELEAEVARLRALTSRRGSTLPGRLSASRIEKLIKDGKVGTYGDGGNLWLQISNGGRAVSWLLRWKLHGHGDNMGLGSYKDVGLEEAREKALGYRRLLRLGKNPKAERDNAKLDEQIAAGRAKTVSQVAHEFFNTMIAGKSASWEGGVMHRLKVYVHDTIGDMPIEKVTTAIIVDKTGLGELWVKKFPTAEKLQNELDRIFRLAIAKGYYHGKNPAAWDTLQHVLKGRHDVHHRRHHPSLPYAQVGQFLKRLRAYRYSSQGRGGSHIRYSPQALSGNADSGPARHPIKPYTLAEAAAACGFHKSEMQRAVSSGKISGTKDEFGVWHVEPAELHRIFPPAPRTTAVPLSPFEQRPMITLVLEFVVLTGVRLNEVRLAQWKEFDLPRRVWTVPWQHLKSGYKHRTDRPVPITKPMLVLLKELQRRGTDQSLDAIVFPARHDGRIFKPPNISTWLDTSAFKWPAKITVHGFRSTLRDWCRANKYPGEWWDIQADHAIGNKTSQSYGHNKLIEERRGMMEAWGEYCSRPAPEPQSADVVKLSEKRKRRSA